MAGDGIVATKAAPREPIPAGNYIARCYSMIYLGTIEEEFEGNKKKAKKVRITWELPTHMKVFKEGEEEKPAVISAEYTLSTSPKAKLLAVINSWRGKALTNKEADAFDITKLLGKACMLNIIHKNGKGDNSEKVYEQIASVAAMPKGIAAPDQINETQIFNYGDKFDLAFVERLPDWVKNKIKSSDEWAAKQPGIIASEQEQHDAEPAMEEPPF